MKCQILFSGKNKKIITNLSSAELAQRVVKVKAINVVDFRHFCKGENFCDFLLAFLHSIILLKVVYCKRKEFASNGTKLLLE